MVVTSYFWVLQDSLHSRARLRGTSVDIFRFLFVHFFGLFWLLGKDLLLGYETMKKWNIRGVFFWRSFRTVVKVAGPRNAGRSSFSGHSQFMKCCRLSLSLLKFWEWFERSCFLLGTTLITYFPGACSRRFGYWDCREFEWISNQEKGKVLFLVVRWFLFCSVAINFISDGSKQKTL